jgi:DNA-binding NarL/FixJ family response regulator
VGSGRDWTEQHLRVVVANDHAGLRRSLRRLLEEETGLEVVGEASDFAITLRHVAAQHPDVLVLDLHMTDRPVPSGSDK